MSQREDGASWSPSLRTKWVEKLTSAWVHEEKPIQALADAWGEMQDVKYGL